ncbi:hypothetical protein R1flu_002876 [Riccia fluitans]|uniref:ABC1 atypical kinase-like domain-containing protein n=1 Tax=Riccia fluitans TaxID=41844 RepID=A0ABD1Y7D4_9MARC
MLYGLSGNNGRSRRRKEALRTRFLFIIDNPKAFSLCPLRSFLSFVAMRNGATRLTCSLAARSVNLREQQHIVDARNWRRVFHEFQHVRRNGNGGYGKEHVLGGRFQWHSTIREFCENTTTNGAYRNVWENLKPKGSFHTASLRSDVNSTAVEGFLLSVSRQGRKSMQEIRQTIKVTGESVAAVRADVKSQGQIAWQILAERGYLHTLAFPSLGRILKAMSLACVRYQVVPRTLAVVVGKATWMHQSAAETLQIPSNNGGYKERSITPFFLVALVLSLVEGLILIIRAAYLATLFAPALIMAPFADYFGPAFRTTWLELVHHTLELAGAAFIKWGQWAATRPDLFPRDLCSYLSKLHSQAPAHNFAQTRKIVEKAFGRKLEEIFEDFEEEPVASGSIAQVHRAVLRFRHPGQKSKPMTVAVKVRHPGVSEVIRRDFTIINWVAKLSTYLPGLSWLRLDESVQQFAVFMLTQVDLAREAAHLSRFIYNFRRWKDVSFPKPLYPLVHPAVLVETYEHGESVARYVDRPEKTRLNSALAHIGTHTLLKMLLVDNFIHADMHPGNILVRVKSGRSAKSFFRSHPHVILLDVGMTAELPQRDRVTLLEFFKAVALRDGRKAAECTLQFSRAQSCPDPEGFKDDVAAVFRLWQTSEGDKLHAGDCIQELLERVRRHRVNIDGDVCTVMVTTLVLEGWQRKLDPELNILDTIHTLLFKADWASSLSYTIDGLMAP